LHGRGDHHAVAQAVGVFQGPAHGVYAAEAAADHRRPLGDAELGGEARLAVNPVPGPQRREIPAPGLAGGGVDGPRPGAAVAAADVVDGHHMEFVGVDGLAGADVGIPPAGLPVLGAVVARRVVVAG